MTTTPTPKPAHPARIRGRRLGRHQTGRPWRTIWGPEATIRDDVVRLSALQYVDGAIETDDSDGPAIHITIGRDWGISAKHHHQCAADGEYPADQRNDGDDRARRLDRR